MRRFVSGAALAAVLSLGAGPALLQAEAAEPISTAPGADDPIVLAQASINPEANADADAPDLDEAPTGPGPGASKPDDTGTGHTAGEATAGEVYDYEPHEPEQDTGEKIGAEPGGAAGSQSGASGTSGAQ